MLVMDGEIDDNKEHEEAKGCEWGYLGGIQEASHVSIRFCVGCKHIPDLSRCKNGSSQAQLDSPIQREQKNGR